MGGTEVFLAYYGQAWFLKERVKIGAGFTGRAHVTGEEVTAREQFQHQVGISGQAAFGAVRPGAYIRMPVGGLLEYDVDFVVGVHVTVVVDS
jgi:hypothetical protein